MRMDAQRSRYPVPILVASLLVVAGLVVLPFLGEPGFADPKTAGPVGLWVQFLGTLHPLFLHLPIGAFLLVLVLETIALVTRGRYAAATLVPLGFTLASGILAPGRRAPERDRETKETGHR